MYIDWGILIYDRFCKLARVPMKGLLFLLTYLLFFFFFLLFGVLCIQLVYFSAPLLGTVNIISLFAY